MHAAMTRTLDERIWEMHTLGVTVTKIATLLDVSAERARAAVTGRWFEDKQAAHFAAGTEKMREKSIAAARYHGLFAVTMSFASSLALALPLSAQTLEVKAPDLVAADEQFNEIGRAHV